VSDGEAQEFAGAQRGACFFTAAIAADSVKELFK
jgi:hypothetical protein